MSSERLTQIAPPLPAIGCDVPRAPGRVFRNFLSLTVCSVLGNWFNWLPASMPAHPRPGRHRAGELVGGRCFLPESGRQPRAETIAKCKWRDPDQATRYVSLLFLLQLIPAVLLLALTATVAAIGLAARRLTVYWCFKRSDC